VRRTCIVFISMHAIVEGTSYSSFEVSQAVSKTNKLAHNKNSQSRPTSVNKKQIFDQCAFPRRKHKQNEYEVIISRQFFIVKMFF